MARAQFRYGTERVVPPEQTLARIAPLLAANGITRCMPVTRLDSLGVPTYCAIRPTGLVLQVSNGKGLSDAAARTSAAMEAIELSHAENPLPARLRRTTLAALRAESADVLAPADLYGFRRGYFTDRFVCDWTEGRNLADGGAPVWAPASAVYFYCTPGLFDTNTNGLASGNDMAEATLHALYELVERDAMSRINVGGTIRIRDYAKVIDPDTIEIDGVRELMAQIEAAGTKVLLLWLPSTIAVHTFWAVTLNRGALAAVSTLNVGWGTHVDPAVAAFRALTEAAQSRLTFIHGAREDIQTKAVFHAGQVQDSAGVRYFEALEPAADWAEVADAATVPYHDDFTILLERVTEALARAGHRRLIGFDLTNPEFGIAVVKVIAPTLQFNHRLF